METNEKLIILRIGPLQIGLRRRAEPLLPIDGRPLLDAIRRELAPAEALIMRLCLWLSR